MPSATRCTLQLCLLEFIWDYSLLRHGCLKLRLYVGERVARYCCIIEAFPYVCGSKWILCFAISIQADFTETLMQRNWSIKFNAGVESERLNDAVTVGPSWLKSPTCCRVNVDLCFSFGAVGNLIGVVHFLPAKVTSLRSELPFADIRAPLQSLESGRECS